MSVSFTVRRPTPVSSRQSSAGLSDSDSFKKPALPRHLSAASNGRSSPLIRPFDHVEGDSSDEGGTEDEIITGFDELGVQRCVLSSCYHPYVSNSPKQRPKPKPKPQGPLVIAALPNRDWKGEALRKKGRFLPSGQETGADGSVGGLGTRDSINSGPQISGLVKRSRTEEDKPMPPDTTPEAETPKEGVPESEDDRARRLLLAGEDESGPSIAPILSSTNSFSAPQSETEAYRSDVLTRPESSTLEDYSRVPVEAFGEALLRGMGWAPGQAASRTRKGPLEATVPTNRPALLGLGAKERVVESAPWDPKSIKKGSSRKELQMKYVPVTKRDSSEPRRRERSLERDERKHASDRERERDRRDRSYENGRDRERDRDRHNDDGRDDRRRDYDRTREYDRDRRRDRDGRRD